MNKKILWRLNHVLILWLLSSLVVAEQICDSRIAEISPASKFEVHSDGTISDTFTGLMWKLCPEGQSGNDCGIGNAEELSWQAALQVPATVNTTGGFSGHTDWRLPNIKELRTLVEEHCYNPAINLVIFPREQNLKVWSNSPSSRNSNNSWFVDFYEGAFFDGNRSDSLSVRLVRNEK